MKVISNDQLIVVDVDGTIILWPDPAELLAAKSADLLAFTDPYDGATRRVLAHKPNIKILKDRKLRGCTIVVWSQSGYAWAAEAVKVLGLTEYVDYVASKPFMYLDDLAAEHWMGKPTCLNANSTWAQDSK